MPEIKENFKGLPMSELIGAPLCAACDAQKKLAATAYEYMREIGFNDDDCKEPKLLKFELERLADTVEGPVPVKVEVQAPFLGLVPIPSLLIEAVDVDFQMEVTATETNKTNWAAEVNTQASVKGGLFTKFSVNVQGKVSTSRENTRTTNQTAKYQVHVAARQQPPTEGLSKLMDIMASCTKQVETKISNKTPDTPKITT